MKVKLEDIVEGMEMQSDESRLFINRETGEIVHISNGALQNAEDGVDEEDEDEHFYEFSEGEKEIAVDIVESFDKYAELPTPFDINEYAIMESFCYSITDVNKQRTLLNSIRGKGAFRRFKDTSIRLGIIEKWYEYRDTAYREIAKEFCEEIGLEYI